MKKYFLLLFIFLFNMFSYSQIYSFEDGVVPTTWTAINGVLNISATKYKLGIKSLGWTWSAGSEMTVNSPDGLSAAATTSSGGVHLWVYNTTPTTNKLVISFLNSSNQEKCHLDFNLNFKGWRCLIAAFAPDMGHDRTSLSKMVVKAPATGSGQFFFDRVEFLTAVAWNRNSDAQYTVAQNPTIHDFWGIRAYGNIPPLSIPTTKEADGIKTIIKRLDDWYMGTGKYATSPDYITRRNAIASYIPWAYKGNPGDLNLTVESDGTVTGPGLYAIFNSNPTGGTAIRYFNNVTCGTMYPLALDYRLNKTALRKTQWLNQIDYLNDQGWADGSAVGLLASELLRSYAYFHSMFMMRNELGPERLARELNTINWHSLYGVVNKPNMKIGDNADFLRNLGYAKLYFALLQPDSAKQVAAIKPVVNYLNNALSLHHGFGETLKPDYTGYHHSGAYFSAYYPAWLYAAVWYYYILRDTPFALSDTIYDNLKNALLTFRSLSSYYDVPTALTGRFPLQTQVTQTLLPAYAMLAMSKNQPDAELIAAFKRLWKPTVSPVKEFVSSSANPGNLNTYGEMEVCVQAAAVNIAEEANPKEAKFLPYAGTLIHRAPTTHLTIKGFSKYVFDYEGGSSLTEGLYNRYLGYGQMEFDDLVTKRRNNNYSDALWDWSRLPGTTSKYIATKSELASVGGKDRNLSDQAFLGGVSLNDSMSMVSMKLHDLMFDNTFYATKSYFCFGNAVVCLGSHINNSSQTARTETTLLQQLLNTGESIKVNGTVVAASQANISNPVISDNLGNRFIVKDGVVDVIKNGQMYAAVIDHGLAPQNKTYRYYMLQQSNDAQEAKYSNVTTCPVTVVRQDATAHIVKNVEANVCGYAIFNHTVQLNDPWINQVNIPSAVMMKKQENGSCELVVSDPDMHRTSGIDSDAIYPVLDETGAPFNYEIVLNDLYELDGENPGVVLTRIGNTTKIALTVIDGKAYKIRLNKFISGLQQVGKDVSSVNTVQNNDENIFRLSAADKRNVFQIQSSVNDKFSVKLISLDGTVVRNITDNVSSCLLDANGLSSGMYVVSMWNEKSVCNVKICIK